MRRKILLSSIVGAMLILLVGCGNVDADKYDSEENVVADGQESVENESPPGAADRYHCRTQCGQRSSEGWPRD